MNQPHQFFAAAFSLAFVTGAARAQSEAANLDDVSTLPIASVGGSQLGSDDEFLVTAHEGDAYATAYTLERLADGASLRVEITGRRAKQSPVVTGTLMKANRISTGIVLVASSEAVAFVPNPLGRALMRDGRMGL